MVSCKQITGGCSIALLVAVAAVLAPILLRIVQLPPDQKFGLSMMHNVTEYPGTVHSRYRGPEYTRTDRFFFQWWNYLIVDAETRDHWSFIYQITNFAENSTNSDVVRVGMAHLKGSTRVEAAGESRPLSDLTVSGDFDLAVSKEGAMAYRQTIIDADTYRITADFSGDRTSHGHPISWELTFHRVHGVYAGHDQEEGNKGDACGIVSSLFGYHTEVEGWIRVGRKVIKFDRSPRYRGYAAGSWGCELPSGYPRVDYPWTWFWLVVPNQDRAQEIGMVFGTATFQTNVTVVGDIYGGYAVTGIGGKVESSRFAELLHGSPLPVPVVASASDGYLSHYKLDFADWADYSDEHGHARIPLRQTYRVATKTLNITVDFRSKLEQYFRAPVLLEKEGRLRVYSDFRAVGVDAHLRIERRGVEASDVLFEGLVSTMNALEYAYEADLDVAAFAIGGAADARERAFAGYNTQPADPEW